MLFFKSCGPERIFGPFSCLRHQVNDFFQLPAALTLSDKEQPSCKLLTQRKTNRGENIAPGQSLNKKEDVEIAL